MVRKWADQRSREEIKRDLLEIDQLLEGVFGTRTMLDEAVVLAGRLGALMALKAEDITLLMTIGEALASGVEDGWKARDDLGGEERGEVERRLELLMRWARTIGHGRPRKGDDIH